MGRAGRPKGDGTAQLRDGGGNDSSASEHTLNVQTQGQAKVTLQIDGGAKTEGVGSHQVPHGAKVLLRGAVSTRGKGDKWQRWEGMPSRSIGTKVAFRMSEDVSLTAVVANEADLPKQNPMTFGGQWVARTPGEGDTKQASEIAALLLGESGLGEKEASELARILQEGNFSDQAMADFLLAAKKAGAELSPENEALLQALHPSITQRIPVRGDASEALAWLRGDRSAIIDPETSIPGVTAAAETLSEAIDAGEKIGVFVDYDADGITSGEVLRSALEAHGADYQIGYADVENGFGLNEDFVRRAHADGCGVILTADCGSESVEAVQLAKDLGMKVIVTDHHRVEKGHDNPADHHLNPQLQGTPAMKETGSQVAWKLGQVLHEVRGGDMENHFQQPIWWAGFGCRADGGEMLDTSNRAFLTSPHVPEGVREVARMLGENPDSDMSDLDATREIMNLGKRLDHIETVEMEDDLTASGKLKPEHTFNFETGQYEETGTKQKPVDGGKVISREEFSAEDVARAFAHPDPEERKEAQKKLKRAYDYYKRLEAESRKAVSESVPSVEKADDKTYVRPEGQPLVGHVVLDDERMSGVSRKAAGQIVQRAATPGIAFVPAGVDEDGNEMVRFSGTGVKGQSAPMGELIDELRPHVDTIGGHEQVFGGSCRKADIERVMEVANTWAAKQENFLPEKAPRVSEDTFLSAERVSPGELARIEKGERTLAPFTEAYNKDKLFAPTVSVVGTVEEIVDAPGETAERAKSSGYTRYAKLRLEDGSTRTVKFAESQASRDQMDEALELQKGEPLEFALKLYPTEGNAHSIAGWRKVPSEEQAPF